MVDEIDLKAELGRLSSGLAALTNTVANMTGGSIPDAVAAENVALKLRVAELEAFIFTTSTRRVCVHEFVSTPPSCSFEGTRELHHASSRLSCNPPSPHTHTHKTKKVLKL